MPQPTRILISAGEASGDLYGAQLATVVRRRCPTVKIFGVGGEHMRAAGCETVIDAQEIAVVGITEILRHLPRIYARFGDLRRAIDQLRPEVGVVIDSPAFNLRVARALHRRGIPVFYYVAPQFWAWRQWRARIVRRNVRKALVIFPFETEFWRRWGVDAEFVGHPLADLKPAVSSRQQFAKQHGVDATKSWIALLPGSRRKEVLMNLPEMLRAAEKLGDACQYLLPVASTLDSSWLQARLQHFAPTRPYSLSLTDDAATTLAHSRAAVVASGTATIIAAMMGTPFVMVYRVSPLTWTLGRPLVSVPHYAMVNLIAGEEVVPELVQSSFTADNIVARLKPLLVDGETRMRMEAGLAHVRERLRAAPEDGNRTTAERAAAAVLSALS